MLYVFTGIDTARAKAEAHKIAQKDEVIVFGEGGESFERVATHLSSQGLFSPKAALILDRPFETAEGKALISEHAKNFGKSPLSIFVIAPHLSAIEKKLFPKDTEFKIFEPKGIREAVRPNVFAFTDSFMAGDRKKTWLGYQKLLTAGISAEEIHGALLWAVRSALIALKTSDAEEAGLKPFVFTKSRRVAERLGVERVEEFSRSLIEIYHKARSGVGSIELGIEHLILEKS